MSPDLAMEIWEALRSHISGGFSAAADDFVQVLVENGFDAQELMEVAQDTNVKKSLLEYVEDHSEYEDEIDEEDEYSFYDDDNDTY